ncbi:MAG: metallophosphoesterase family protein [Calditrichaceae bacterium]|nr:metallophosphoesterase family protein [Calditrichaceae bacterium]
MKIAFISDIHGNAWALRAVLDDIKEKGIKEIYDLGDSLYGPLDPKGTYHLLADWKIESVCGNQDRIIIENADSPEINPTLKYVKNQLSEKAMLWLEELPACRIVHDQIYLCHGTPANDSGYLLEQLHDNFVGIKDYNQIEILLADVKQKIIICGHSHKPGLVETQERLIINPGSVGLPAYDDELPMPHKIENYSPKARYCIIDLDRNLTIEHVAVSYDYENAALAAEKNKREDWARWLRTGRA